MDENAMNSPKRNLDENTWNTKKQKTTQTFFRQKKTISFDVFRQVKAFTAKGEGAAAVGTSDL